MMPDVFIPGTMICRLPGKNQLGLFRKPREVLLARDIAEIIPLFSRLEDALRAGYWAAGAISYESASAFDSACPSRASSFPLLWMGIYDFPEKFILPHRIPWRGAPRLIPECERSEYLDAVTKVHSYILDGDIYQANLTFRARGTSEIDSSGVFLSCLKHHPVPYASYLNSGDWQLISLSPELFLERRGDFVKSEPMKGTAARALSVKEDRQIAVGLNRDPKNRAENIMITDMVRNDLGRICLPGSVGVDYLCRVRHLPSVHQMVSMVHGKLRPGTSVLELLAAMFPAASITGAPKIRAMQIIRDLENSSRNFYTGSLGCFAPSGDICLNVAIRTLLCCASGTELGIGSGIVADSQAAEEWRECRLKGRFTSYRLPKFKVLETIRWDSGNGFLKLGAHLRRAAASQRYFSRPWRGREVRRSLDRLHRELSGNDAAAARVRMLIDREGKVELEWFPLTKCGWGEEKLRVLSAGKRLSSTNIFLHHKTTHRQVYDNGFKRAVEQGFDEVLFSNERGDLTEGSISNIILLCGGRWLTPPQSSGLLPGIWREDKIRELKVREQRISLSEIGNAERIIIGNSVRGSGEIESIIGEDGRIVWKRTAQDSLLTG